nr:hypothetical protein [Tanacetum cinerariifolium]
MEQPNPTFAKIPILDTGKLEQCKFRIQQYLQNEHYALWEAEGSETLEQIFNRLQAIVSHLEFIDVEIEQDDLNQKFFTSLAPEWLINRKGEVNTDSILTVSTHVSPIKYEDINQINEDDIKEMDIKWNMALLKGSETLEQIFNRLQAIVSHLEFMDVEIEQDDLNQKFFTSLAPEWLMYMIVWRNRCDLDTMSLDDLYNHLIVYEPEVQKKSELNSQNMAFISSSKTTIGKGKLTLIVF